MPKVMIVDDDRNMVSLLKILLEMDGYEVINLTNGKDFVPKVREENPDLLLIDVFISNTDGKKLVADLRATPDLETLRVIMTSGMDLAEQCKEAGADAFLLKPYTPEQLINIIETNIRPQESESEI